MRLFQLIIYNEFDVKEAVKGNSWIIPNTWFVVHSWDRDVKLEELDFNHASLWIQIWEVTIDCKSISIGAQLSEVEDNGRLLLIRDRDYCMF